jgi:hypothetical protein
MSDDILIGIKAIQCCLHGVSERTIMQWTQIYESIPIRKIGGQWSAHRIELDRWFRAFVTDDLANYKKMQPEMVKPPIKKIRRTKAQTP